MHNLHIINCNMNISYASFDLYIIIHNLQTPQADNHLWIILLAPTRQSQDIALELCR